MVLTARARRRAFGFAKAISQSISGSLKNTFRNIAVQVNADFFNDSSEATVSSRSSLRDAGSRGDALFGERCKNIARTRAGEGGGDVGAEPEAPVRPLAVGAGQIGRDRLADQVVELGVGEDRTGAANQRMDSRGRRVVERRVFGGRRGHEAGRDERGDERSLLLAPRRDRLARGRKGRGARAPSVRRCRPPATSRRASGDRASRRRRPTSADRPRAAGIRRRCARTIAPACPGCWPASAGCEILPAPCRGPRRPPCSARAGSRARCGRSDRRADRRDRRPRRAWRPRG